MNLSKLWGGTVNVRFTNSSAVTLTHGNATVVYLSQLGSSYDLSKYELLGLSNFEVPSNLVYCLINRIANNNNSPFIRIRNEYSADQNINANLIEVDFIYKKKD